MLNSMLSEKNDQDQSHSNGSSLPPLRDLSRWATVFAIVTIIIFGCAQLGLLIRFSLGFTEAGSKLSAEYGPWQYTLIHSIRPEIIQEIMSDQKDSGDQGSTFEEPEEIPVGWIDTTPTEVAPTEQPTDTPIATMTATATSSATPTETSTPTPTATSTSTPTPTPETTATYTPTTTYTPTATSTTTNTPEPPEEFTHYPSYGTYASNGIMNPNTGSITIWLNFQVGQNRTDHIVVHSDDSRWVLYIDTFYASGLGRNILSIAARAGGNKVATNDAGTHTGYPEARLIVDNDGSLRAVGYGEGSPWLGVDAFPEGEWHHVAMTWNGYPNGVVKFYLDGILMSSFQYDSRYDDGQPLYEMFSFGHKPYSWPAVENLPVLGDSGSGRLVVGGILSSDMRIYTKTLTQPEIQQIVTAGP